MNTNLPPSGDTKFRGPLSEGCCHWTPIAFPATDARPVAGSSNLIGDSASSTGEADAASPVAALLQRPRQRQ